MNFDKIVIDISLYVFIEKINQIFEVQKNIIIFVLRKGR